MTDKILAYLKDTYQPDAIIAYGSFADGSANKNSDFDALVIADKERMHDSSVIDGIVLDVFIYPPDTFRQNYDPEEFVQVWDGNILLDTNGVAASLQKQVLDYIAHIPRKTAEEISQEVSWCEKMLSRTMREDAEGYYRWHWVLFDSLEIYFDVKGLYYYGPKKALRFLEQTDPESFRIYTKALREFKRECLATWISHLRSISPTT
ncbi:MAG: nucleotidyltransferase domain-containing protein [Oscillospiraceae bacterium]|nr:nucleotidyltransferase domain-containing protein [Oscillospiraceae bacterium]